jgi:hypothetical protein
LSAYLIVLFAAIRVHGSPEALVSDGGGVFRASEAMRIYGALGIRKEQIERRQPWQSYIETTFNVQRRMADWHFAKATNWEELQTSHDRWVNDYDSQEHWAHRKREDGRRSPSEVLGWVTSNTLSLEELQRIFRTARGERRVNKAGYIRFRHWDVYGEHGLAKQRVAVWLSADSETLTVEYSDEPLAQYLVAQEPNHKHLKSVAPLRLFDTRFRSPQLALWEPDFIEWRLAIRRPEPASRRRRQIAGPVQEPLLLTTDSSLTAKG